MERMYINDEWNKDVISKEYLKQIRNTLNNNLDIRIDNANFDPKTFLEAVTKKCFNNIHISHCNWVWNSYWGKGIRCYYPKYIDWELIKKYQRRIDKLKSKEKLNEEEKKKLEDLEYAKNILVYSDNNNEEVSVLRMWHVDTIPKSPWCSLIEKENMGFEIWKEGFEEKSQDIDIYFEDIVLKSYMALKYTKVKGQRYRFSNDVLKNLQLNSLNKQDFFIHKDENENIEWKDISAPVFAKRLQDLLLRRKYTRLFTFKCSRTNGTPDPTTNPDIRRFSYEHVKDLYENLQEVWEIDGSIEGTVDNKGKDDPSDKPTKSTGKGSFSGKARGKFFGIFDGNEKFNEKMEGEFAGELTGRLDGRFDGELNGESCFHKNANWDIKVKFNGNCKKISKKGEIEDFYYLDYMLGASLTNTIFLCSMKGGCRGVSELRIQNKKDYNSKDVEQIIYNQIKKIDMCNDFEEIIKSLGKLKCIFARNNLAQLVFSYLFHAEFDNNIASQVSEFLKEKIESINSFYEYHYKYRIWLEAQKRGEKNIETEEDPDNWDYLTEFDTITDKEVEDILSYRKNKKSRSSGENTQNLKAGEMDIKEGKKITRPDQLYAKIHLYVMKSIWRKAGMAIPPKA